MIISRQILLQKIRIDHCNMMDSQHDLTNTSKQHQLFVHVFALCMM